MIWWLNVLNMCAETDIKPQWMNCIAALASRFCIFEYWQQYCTALKQWASAKLGRSAEDATCIRQGGHHIGHWPTFWSVLDTSCHHVYANCIERTWFWVSVFKLWCSKKKNVETKAPHGLKTYCQLSFKCECLSMDAWVESIQTSFRLTYFLLFWLHWMCILFCYIYFCNLSCIGYCTIHYYGRPM